MPETRTIKIRMDTYRQLKVLAAQNGETLMNLVSRLAQKEAQLPTELPTNAGVKNKESG